MQPNNLTTFVLTLSKDNNFDFEPINPVPKLPSPYGHEKILTNTLSETKKLLTGKFENGLTEYVPDTELTKYAPDDYPGMQKSLKLTSLFNELKETLLPGQKNGFIAIKFDPKDFISAFVSR